MDNAINNNNTNNDLGFIDYDYAYKWAKQISSSELCPKQYKGKPGDVIIAVQLGHEVGLKPMQSLQSVCVINGMPSLFGDGPLSLCKSTKHFEDIEEWIEGSIESGDAVAYCKVKRNGQTAQVRTFSMKEAVRAQLINKPGAWKTYPSRMLSLRARSFALRDVFPDILKGIRQAEEAMDMPKDTPKDVTPKEKSPKKSEELKKILIENSQEDYKLDFESIKSGIQSCKNEDELMLQVDLIREVDGITDDEKQVLRDSFRDKAASFSTKK